MTLVCGVDRAGRAGMSDVGKLSPQFLQRVVRYYKHTSVRRLTILAQPIVGRLLRSPASDWPDLG